MVDIHIKMGPFMSIRHEIHAMAANAAYVTEQKLPLKERVRLTILNKPEETIPGYGHGATTYSKTRIVMRLDPNFPKRYELLHTGIPREVSHELHHAARWQAVGYGNSLSRALVSEGLAEHFETEMWGGEPSPWANALSDRQLQTYVQKAILEIRTNDTGYDHDRWFYGKGDLPMWTGYSVGYHIISEYLKYHPGESAASLVATPANVILESVFGEALYPKPFQTPQFAMMPMVP